MWEEREREGRTEKRFARNINEPFLTGRALFERVLDDGDYTHRLAVMGRFRSLSSSPAAHKINIMLDDGYTGIRHTGRDAAIRT